LRRTSRAHSFSANAYHTYSSLPYIEAENIVQDVEGSITRGQQLENLTELLRYLFSVYKQVPANHYYNTTTWSWLAVNRNNVVFNLLKWQALDFA
jgi:hypothetical protein